MGHYSTVVNLSSTIFRKSEYTSFPCSLQASQMTIFQKLDLLNACYDLKFFSVSPPLNIVPALSHEDKTTSSVFLSPPQAQMNW